MMGLSAAEPQPKGSHRVTETRSLENKSFDTILEQAGVEVDEKSDLLARDSQVRQDLSVEQRLEPFDAFNLNNDGVFD